MFGTVAKPHILNNKKYIFKQNTFIFFYIKTFYYIYLHSRLAFSNRQTNNMTQEQAKTRMTQLFVDFFIEYKQDEYINIFDKFSDMLSDLLRKVDLLEFEYEYSDDANYDELYKVFLELQ